MMGQWREYLAGGARRAGGAAHSGGRAGRRGGSWQTEVEGMGEDGRGSAKHYTNMFHDIQPYAYVLRCSLESSIRA
jgi:hypothetical protein